MPTVDAASTTARSLIERALKTIGKLGLGESLDGTLAHDCLLTLNEMLDHWRTQDFLVFRLTRIEVPVTAGDGVYTLGVGGDIDTPRPNEIYAAAMRDPVAPHIERKLQVLDEREHAGRPWKTQTANVSTAVFYDPVYPLPFGTLYLLPVTTPGGAILVLYLLSGLTEFPDLNTDVQLPHGYLKALRYNLALELAPDHGVEPPRHVYVQAAQALADIKRRNIRHRPLMNDFVRSSGYNIYTDEWGR